MTSRPQFLLPFALLLLMRPVAAAEEVTLAPPGTTVAFRAYAIGLFPLDGIFTRFDGVLTYDDQGHDTCRVDLHVEVASLTLSDTAIREDLVGPEFMNAALFPTLRFRGTCRGPEIVGELAMHGVTRPFTLDLTRTETGLIAQGRLRRAEWGMTARPLIGGTTARITVQVRLPAQRSVR